ncbi:MAG: hypothetical protein M3134_01910, partial [Actinomycetota bacterium]|nr:hypothetical protein [Actinomycetota bacterium]
MWGTLLDDVPDDAAERAQIVEALMGALLDPTAAATTSVYEAYIEESEALLADEELDLQVIVEVLSGARSSDPNLADRAGRRDIDLGAISWCVARCDPKEEAGQYVRGPEAGAAVRRGRPLRGSRRGVRAGGVPAEAARRDRARGRVSGRHRRGFPPDPCPREGSR